MVTKLDEQFGSMGTFAEAFLARYPTKTREGYRIHIRNWFEWLEQQGIQDPLSVSDSLVNIWARHLLDSKGLSKQTVCSKLNAVCGFYRFAVDERRIDRNPTLKVARPRIEFESRTTSVSAAELRAVLDAGKAESATSWALIGLLGLTGLRVGECIALDIDDVSHQNGATFARIRERGGADPYGIPLSVEVAYAIQQCTAGRTMGPVLCGRDGGRISAGAVRRTVRRLAKASGLVTTISPMSFRHAFITCALDAGISDREVASAADISVRMLAYYKRNQVPPEQHATHAVAALVNASR